MDPWRALFNLGVQERAVKRAPWHNFGLAVPVHPVDLCFNRAVSEMDHWNAAIPGFFQASNPQSIASELLAAQSTAVVDGDRTFSVLRFPRIREAEGIKLLGRENKERKI